MIANNIEYEEAPSGHVTFYNYKEPLMKFNDPNGDGGHGFVGALVFDGNSDKIQCHFCGQWFDSLGNHINKEHALKSSQYKEIVGLNKKTALINEKIRAKLIASGLDRRMKNLVNQKGVKRSQATRDKIRATLKENRDEQKNLRGTCPEQLIERLVKLYRKLGRTPTYKEVNFEEALVKTYGSMREACMVAGIPYRQIGQTKRMSIYTEDYFINYTRDFFDKEGRLPIKSDLTEGQWKRFTSYGKNNIYRQALAMDGRYRQSTKRFRYTKDDLIRFLQVFEKINNRKPSYSDCKRGLLPVLSRYSYNFGSWKNALQLAFPGYSPVRILKEKKKYIPRPKIELSLRQRYLKGKKFVAARRERLLKVSALK